MISAEQLRVFPVGMLSRLEPKLSEEAKRGEPVAKYLKKWGTIAAGPYLLYGIYSGFSEQWWPNGLGLMVTAVGIYTLYEKFYERYLKKPQEEKFLIKKRVAFFERRPKVAISWQ